WRVNLSFVPPPAAATIPTGIYSRVGEGESLSFDDCPCAYDDFCLLTPALSSIGWRTGRRATLNSYEISELTNSNCGSRGINPAWNARRRNRRMDSRPFSP